MTDTSPNSPFDRLTQDVAALRRELDKINKRLDETDLFSLELLKILKSSEESFTLRVARAQLSLYSGLTHSLEHSIEDYADKLAAKIRGFEVQVVDDEKVVENNLTILVTRREDGGFDYAPVSDPSAINNQGTEPFTKYFQENPAVFGDKAVLRVNVLSTVPAPTQEVPADGQA
jgi:hypothetical protein